MKREKGLGGAKFAPLQCPGAAAASVGEAA